MKISTNLPNSIHGIVYVKNSHWIELEDTNGTRHRVHDNSMQRFECTACDFFFLTRSNLAHPICNSCQSPMRKQWQRMQVCFVPENESTFHMPQDHDEQREKKG